MPEPADQGREPAAGWADMEAMGQPGPVRLLRSCHSQKGTRRSPGHADRDRFAQFTDQSITEPDAKRIIEIIKANVRLITLAVGQYRILLRELPWSSEIPMKGLGIGEHLGWLTRKLQYDGG
ncbi:hypothetical protein ACW0JT_15370 [Arthrobacter sp. SA17]